MVQRAFPHEAPEACIKSQDEFCRIYWPVIHLSLRQKHQYSHHDAEDLAQSFVTWLLASESMGKSRKEKGRFRSFLLAHLDNFVRNQLQKQHAEKRGGKARQVSLEEAEHEPPLADARTPDRELSRAWSIATLREAHERLRQAYQQRGKEVQFAALLPFLSAHEDERRAMVAAAALGITLPAFRMARSRFRKEFGQVIANLVSATVDTDEDFAEEMKLIREIAG
jgi:RNA polymerase sigma-70 factor (ECF subfamily)